jgi:hypothetical protein
LAAFCAYRQPEPDEPEYDECLAVKAMTDKNAYQQDYLMNAPAYR